MRIIIAISGASGAIYGIRILQLLKDLRDVESHLVMSPTARLNIGLETDWSAADVEGLADVVHKNSNIGASIASGSFKTEGMIVAACSMKTLSGIVHSFADDLITRASDVALKERRKLILMPRETPLHSGHCKLLLEASQLGAIIAPPLPALYMKPASLDEMVTHSCARVLDVFNLDVGALKRWPGIDALRTPDPGGIDI